MRPVGLTAPGHNVLANLCSSPRTAMSMNSSKLSSSGTVVPFCHDVGGEHRVLSGFANTGRASSRKIVSYEITLGLSLKVNVPETELGP